MKKRIKCHNQSHNTAKENRLDSVCFNMFLDLTPNSRFKKKNNNKNTAKQTELHQTIKFLLKITKLGDNLCNMK